MRPVRVFIEQQYTSKEYFKQNTHHEKSYTCNVQKIVEKEKKSVKSEEAAHVESPGLEVIKLCFMLNSAEYLFFPAH